MKTPCGQVHSMEADVTVVMYLEARGHWQLRTDIRNCEETNQDSIQRLQRKYDQFLIMDSTNLEQHTSIALTSNIPRSGIHWGSAVPLLIRDDCLALYFFLPSVSVDWGRCFVVFEFLSRNAKVLFFVLLFGVFFFFGLIWMNIPDLGLDWFIHSRKEKSRALKVKC